MLEFLQNAPTEGLLIWPRFQQAAALAAYYEWQVRVLADLTPELSAKVFDLKLEKVEDAIFVHYRPLLTENESAFLTRARQLRNKLFHGDFKEVRVRLEQDGFAKRPGAFKVATIPAPAGLTPESFLAATAKAEPFAVDAVPHQGHLHEWRMQLAADGSFEAAAQIFNQALIILARLNDARAEAQQE